MTKAKPAHVHNTTGGNRQYQKVPEQGGADGACRRQYQRTEVQMVPERIGADKAVRLFH